jgi:hypothetical protein
MTGTISVFPAADACVRQPERLGEPVPAAGCDVPDNSYYRRFLLTGDLIEGRPEAVPAAKPVPEAPIAAEGDQPRRRRSPPPTHNDQE